MTKSQGMTCHRVGKLASLHASSDSSSLRLAGSEGHHSPSPRVIIMQFAIIAAHTPMGFLPIEITEFMVVERQLMYPTRLRCLSSGLRCSPLNKEHHHF